MYRTEKSRVTGSSKTKITSGNLVGFALGQKNSKRKISNTLFANNKRQYTRKSVVWMCYECSGTGDSVRDNVRETIKKGESVFSDARATGWLSKPADEATQLQMAKKMESLRVLEGETFNGVQQQAKDLVEELESMYRIGRVKKNSGVVDSPAPTRADARAQARGETISLASPAIPARAQRTGMMALFVSCLRGFSWFWAGTMTLAAVSGLVDGTLPPEALQGFVIMAIPLFLVLKFIPKNV